MASSPHARRRQRSVRLTVAAVLLVAAAGLVAGALAHGATLFISAAAVAAVVLGAASSRITHAEVLATRRESYEVQARQAQAYAVLTERRAAENAEFIDGMNGRLTEAHDSLAQVESALQAAQRRAADAARRARTERKRADRAEQEGQDYARRLEDAEARADEAALRVAELEHEREGLHAELDALRDQVCAWEAMAATPPAATG